MLNTLNTKLFRSEATPVASAMPCHSFDPKRRLGYAPALSGSFAR
jgi:hypothetical protein